MSNSKILFLTKYDSLGASSRYRTLQYIPYLPTNIEYKILPLFDDNYLKQLYKTNTKPLFKAAEGYLKRFFNLKNLNQYTSIILENELWPYLPFALEKNFLANKQKLVLIYDDAIFHNYNNHKIGKLMQFADTVIVGNQYLANYTSNWNSNFIIIPTVISAEKYKQNKIYTQKNPLEKLKIIWVGSPTTANYLYELNELWQNNWVQDNIHLFILGAINLNLGNIQTTYIPWNEATEVEEIQKCDLGIMPLPDNNWTKGKCGFKIIQYMASGLPSIASAIGANCEIIQNDKTGFLTNKTEDWLKYLKLFKQNPELLEIMGLNARKEAFEKYTVQATYQTWLKAIL